MKILFLQHNNKGLYYDEFLRALSSKFKVFVYGPGHSYYSIQHTLGDILKICSFKPDVVVIGAGWENDTDEYIYDPHPRLNLTSLQSFNIPKVMILNKEYKKLARKMKFIQRNKIDLVFTVHHHYYTWKELFNTRVERMPFAANNEVFKDYGLKKTYDVGFSGNLFNTGPYKETSIMGPNFNNIRSRIKDIIEKDVEIKNLNLFWRPNQYIYGSEYSRIMNQTKIWISTPSAIDIVGTRFFEILGSKSLLFCKKSDAYQNLFKDGQDCVMFDDDLTDFKEKLLYYLYNDDERNNIIEKGYELFINNHTWKHRVDFFTNAIKELKK